MNKKLLYSSIFGVLLLSAFVVAGVLYFHQTPVDLVVSEGRVSADLPFTLTAHSGETVTKEITIHNNAVVPLNAMLTWTENTNDDGVTYTTNLPINVTLTPLEDTVITFNATFSTITEAGTVNGTINYQKIA